MMRKANMPDLWREDNLDEHYLVIIDNLVSSPPLSRVGSIN